MLHDAQQLDRVAQFRGEFHVQLRHLADAFGVNLMMIHPEAVRERGEDADLVLRVMAVNVQVRRRLGVTVLLRVGEHAGKVRALGLHARQNVIAGAVDDAVNRGKLVRDKTLAQRFDDGNAAADAGLVIKIRAAFRRGRKQFRAVRGEQGLVGGDHGFALRERGENHRPGDAAAADEFDDDLDLRIVDDFLPVGGHQFAGDRIRARLVERLDGDFAENELHAEARGHEAAVFLPRVEDAAADGSAANHSEVHLLHRARQLAAKWSRGQFKE